MTRRTVFSRLALAVLSTLGSSGCVQAFKATREFSLSAPWDNYERIVVRSRNGDVSLLPGEGDEIAISGVKWARGATLEKGDARIDQLEIATGRDPANPSTFLIELRYPRTARRFSAGADFDIRIPQSCGADIDITSGQIVVRGLKDRVELESSYGSIVAEDIAGSVDARTRNGRISAARIKGNLTAESTYGSIVASAVTGDCSLMTSNGRIEAERIEGDLTAQSTYGTIVASAVTGDCSFVTSNGRIKAERIEGSVHAIASYGTIRVQADPPTDGRVVMRTSNGSIYVTLPAEIVARVKLRTSNGRIHTDFADATLQRVSLGRNLFECTLNGGETGLVSASTSYGSIHFTCR